MLASSRLSPPINVLSERMDGLVEILHENVNLAVWQRKPATPVEQFARSLLDQGHHLAEALTLQVEPQDTVHLPVTALAHRFAHLVGYSAFVEDVSHLVSAFACLFDVRTVGLRLRTLDTGMCPRWHVDHVPVRLITSYAGPGSQWLEEHQLARRYLGSPAVDTAPGAMQAQSLATGDVALLKGERWQGNEGRGLIHRSPPLQGGERRLLLTLDWLE